jgi:hypothetical protein
MGVYHLFPSGSKGLWQVRDLARRSPKVPHSFAALTKHLLGLFKGLLHQFPCGITLRNTVSGSLEAPNHSLYALQQRVMQFSRDALALSQSRFEPTPN